MPMIYLIFLWKKEKEVGMDQIGQHENDSSISSSKTNQSLPPRDESEDCEAVSLPYQIYLHRFTETKTQLFRCQDRSKWLAFILEQLSESNLLEKELIEQYLRHQYRRMCTARTVENAYTTIHSFLTHLYRTTHRSLRELSRSDLEAFVEHEQDRGLKRSSVHVQLARLRAFIHFLIDQEVLPSEVLSRKLILRLPEALPKAMAACDVKQLMSVVTRVRDKALLLVLLRTGMRIGELLNAKVCDVDRAEHKIMVYQAPKTSVGRVVYFSDDAKRALEAWLEERNPDAEYLFYGYGNRVMSYGGARAIFVKYLKKAGLADKGYTIHCLRHTCASELLNAGMRLECLQKLLGHTNAEITRRYARLTDKTREKEYFRAMERIERGEIDGDY
jgi:site-specific recombinase XerD